MPNNTNYTALGKSAGLNPYYNFPHEQLGINNKIIQLAYYTSYEVEIWGLFPMKERSFIVELFKV